MNVFYRLTNKETAPFVELTETKEKKTALQTEVFKEFLFPTPIKHYIWFAPYWQNWVPNSECTYGIPQARQSHLHSHRQCHISTKTEYICQFCNGTVKGRKEGRKPLIWIFIYLFLNRNSIVYEKLDSLLMLLFH